MQYGLYILIIAWLATCGKLTKSPIQTITKGGSANFQHVFKNTQKYEVQFLYTQIDINEDGNPQFTSYRFRVDTTQYFYPASTVKMPVAFLSLHKINELKASLNPSIDRSNTLLVDAEKYPQTQAFEDSSAINGKPTIQHYIDKIFAVSDNDAYNRLYEWLGQDYINQELTQKGVFTNSRITHRVGVPSFDTESNKYTNPLSLISRINDTLYRQPQLYAQQTNFQAIKNTLKGEAYFVDSTQMIVHEPFDMSRKNFINIIDLERAIKRIIFPNSFSRMEQFNLSLEDYTFLRESMQRTPREHPYLQNHKDDYNDSYVKFFMYGDTQNPIPEYINIYNKVGHAYGYLTDCAYIEDTKNNIQFFLTATIHVNENKIYKDGQYEYEQIGIPFLAELGRKVYAYELQKKY